jgi:hypothetical protein
MPVLPAIIFRQICFLPLKIALISPGFCWQNNNNENYMARRVSGGDHANNERPVARFASDSAAARALVVLLIHYDQNHCH